MACISPKGKVHKESIGIYPKLKGRTTKHVEKKKQKKVGREGYGTAMNMTSQCIKQLIN